MNDTLTTSAVVTPNDSFGLDNLTTGEFRRRIDRLLHTEGPRFRRLWAYYRNTFRARPANLTRTDSGSDRPYRLAQEWGLPSRITGVRSGAEIFSCEPVGEVARKEVVIENDIGWRVDTMVDYLFGRPIVVNSAAPDPDRRALIERLLRLILAQSGGITFLQQLALLGSVYGFVDVLVKFDAENVATDVTTPIETSCGVQELGAPPMYRTTEPTSDGAGSSAGNERAESNNADRPEHSLPSAAGSASGEPVSAETKSPSGASRSSSLQALQSLARRIRLEIVEPARALPILAEDDYRCVRAYAQVYECARNVESRRQIIRRRLFDRLIPRFSNRASADEREQVVAVEIITPDGWRKYENEQLVEEGGNSLGEIPLIHIQNTAVPFEYDGASDVEPLIPVQDELNCRLSDRAYRITMQSFKMYLGKGIENFTELPVAPGRMWMTDNEKADVVEFGGDGKTFSEDNHIIGLRDAMDKISGVTPIAAGAIKGRIGRLTSAAALRVTMLALLAKTERKRTTYGRGIQRICELALAWLDCAGLFHTTPDERRVELHWPSPIPVNQLERLQEALAKLNVGVPREVVLRELGY